MAIKTLNVRGMSCNHCVHTIAGTLTKLGVEAEVSLPAGSVTVRYNEGETSLEQIIAAIKEQGYGVVL